jgi:hypothetical protein
MAGSNQLDAIFPPAAWAVITGERNGTNLPSRDSPKCCRHGLPRSYLVNRDYHQRGKPSVRTIPICPSLT